MADSKIDFSFENLHFSCKGDNARVERQLNNVLSRIPALLSAHKKNETVVEEVFEIKEEDLTDNNDTFFETEIPVAPKVKKIKPAKAKVKKEKIVKEPKAKAVKTPKIEKQPKIKVEKVPKENSEQAERPMVKSAKKKIAKSNLVTEPVDSPLLQFITGKKALKNQVRKFLATAVFLAKSNNVSRLTTPMISKALKSYGIEKLQNASDCLNKNEKKGYCVKDGKEFIISENGYLSLD